MGAGRGQYSESAPDNFNLKIAELEKKLIEESLERMKFTDEK